MKTIQFLRLYLAFILFLSWVPQWALACEYCASTTSVCVDYEDYCSSYSYQCNGYETVCDTYQDVCDSYDQYCDAYDDNGDCVSYSEYCTSYTSTCTSYSQNCTGYTQVCDNYETRCVQYQDACTSYYYGDYLTVTGTLSSFDTGNAVAGALVTQSDNKGNHNSVYSNSAGRYSNTLFVYDDGAGYLNTQVCAASDSASATVCRNISIYDTCSSPTVERSMQLNLDKLPAPSNITIASTSHTQLTASWTPTYGNISGFYIAWAAGTIAPDCRTGHDVGYTSSYVIQGLSPLTLYTISVCAYDSNKNNSLEALGSQTTRRAPPPSPVNLQLNSSTTSDAVATWTSGGGSTAGFYAAFAQGGSTPNCLGGNDVGSQLSKAYHSLSPGTLYSFSVCSYDVYGNYSTPLTGTVRTKYLPPPSATALTVTANSASKLTANWGSGGGSTSGYFVNFALGDTAPNCAAGSFTSSTSKSFTGLLPLTTYSVSVCASNPDGVISSAISSSGTTKRLPPPAPTTLSMTAVSPYQIDLSWTSSNGGTTGFFLAYAKGNSAPDCDTGLDVGSATSYSLTGLTGLTTYSVSICAYDAYPDSDSSSPLTGSKSTLRAPPPAPTDLSIVASSTSKLSVSWKSGGGSTSAFYFKYAAGSTAPDCKTGSNIGTVTAKSIYNLTTNSTYTVSICAKDSTGLYSTQVSATQTTLREPPPSPKNLSVSALSDSSLRATWSSGGGSTSGYYVAVASGYSDPQCDAGQDNGASTSITFSQLLPSTVYTIALCSYDSYGTKSQQSSYSKRTLNAPPPSPTNLVISVISSSQISLQWTSGGGSTYKFRIAKAIGSVPPKCSSSSRRIGNVTSYKYTGLSSNTKYSFTVCAYDRNKVYSLPLSGSATTLRNRPPAPEITSVSATSTSSLSLTWKSGGGLTTGYYLAYAQGSTSPACTSGVSLPNQTSYVITGLNSNTKYAIALCAVDDIGLVSNRVTTTKTTK